MLQACAKVVVRRVHEHLDLVMQSAESPGVDDARVIAAELCPTVVRFIPSGELPLRQVRITGQRRTGRERLLLLRLVQLAETLLRLRFARRSLAIHLWFLFLRLLPWLRSSL